MNESRLMICPECGRIASVVEWCKRPICVHAWDGNVPEVWDGDDTDGNGRQIEESPNEEYRVPGPDTWSQMMPYSEAIVEAYGRRANVVPLLRLAEEA